MQRPQVTVIIPTYNRATTLSRAVDSVRRQTLSAWTLIIVDDASVDGTGSLLEEFKRVDDRITFIRHDVNLGNGCGARNTGILSANTEFIAFLDSDDQWPEDHLEVLLRSLNGHDKSVCGVFAGAIVCDSSRKMLRHAASSKYTSMRHMLTGNGFGGSNSGVLLRKRVFDQAGLYDLTLKKKTDMDMWLRISLVGEWKPVVDSYVRIYIDAPNRMASNRVAVFKGKAQFFFKHRRLFQENKLEHIGLRKLAREAMINAKSLRLSLILLMASVRSNRLYLYGYIYFVKIFFLKVFDSTIRR